MPNSFPLHARIPWLFLCLTLVLPAQTSRALLDGQWNFALDPVDAGVEQAWFKPGLSTEKWDKVTVPHCYSVDPRYHYYTGTTWYLKSFPATVPPRDVRTFIRFDAVFYQAQVWLNGKPLGAHEGGYTPFEFDVTGLISTENLLAVRVNNAWSTATIPGAKTKVAYQSLNYGQLYPWMNFGGITRPVNLITRPEIHLDKVKIETVPDLVAKTAVINIQAFVRNRSSQPWNGEGLALAVYREGEKIPVSVKVDGGEVGPQSDAVLRIEATLAKADVSLWSFDSPVLYQAEITAGKDVAKVSFGIRTVSVRGTKLLLNGEALSLGGCNRPLDSPGNGSIDPAALLEKDLRLIKSGGMELSRISHYPVSTELLDWADRHGLLIISEAGNWQLTPEQMADPVMREKYRAQLREMVERDWNHPSVIAYSLGNEYQSQTEEGKAWTKDMYAFAKSIDPSRLVTFASYVVFRPGIKKPEDEASQYVDFISTNIYGDHLACLQRIHALYPDKPVYVSEFGQRADAVKTEAERVNYLQNAMADFRRCDFLAGASVWTFNDYESSFPGSNANGYRPWGLVAPDRTPRAMYSAWQTEFSPAVVDVRPAGGGRFEVSVAVRKDFPSYPLRNYTLRAGGRVFPIPLLAPGESRTFTIRPAGRAADWTVELEKPGGFVILSRVISSPPPASRTGPGARRHTR
ncbi:MAG TPA: glycoside hydrolase family 2 TIM barrel-domain containing protein [Rariglobus sp.]